MGSWTKLLKVVPALQLAREYVALATAHPVPMKTLIFHVRRMAKEQLTRFQLLADVLKASGVKLNDKTTVFVRAVDGYAAQVTAAELTKYRFIVATHMDGQPLSLGGLGPLWAVYDADRFPDMAAKPVSARFAWCPWATYHIEVKEA